VSLLVFCLTAPAPAPGPARFVCSQIRPNDPFGRQMVTNIAHRGCPLRGVTAVPDLPAQVRRFRRAGWAAVAAVDVRTFYYRYGRAGGRCGRRMWVPHRFAARLHATVGAVHRTVWPAAHTHPRVPRRPRAPATTPLRVTLVQVFATRTAAAY